ncbi:unnamed protein product [Ilex paraguariensis]|uniref:Uncharacterized protein n=1 Tax=Ilex paraguariensis TaxID=185542 RepID=A0ABC8UR97_9AQUA
MPPPNPRVAKAFHAMRDLGISEEKVKPVLKKLLKLYDKNWELIEEENYRALADNIFETEEAEVEEHKKKLDNIEREKKDLEDETQVHDEIERPLKRLRLRHQEGQASPSLSNSGPGFDGTAIKKPKVEDNDLPESRPKDQLPNITESPQLNTGNVRIESQPVSPQPLGRNKGKQPVSPKSLSVQEGSDSPLIGAADRTQAAVMKRIDSNPISSPMRLRDRGKGPLSPQINSREKRPIADKSSHAVVFKEPKVEPVVRLPRQKMPQTHALIKPKEEPSTDDVPQFEVPLAVIHPESLNEGDSSLENGPLREQRDPAPLASLIENREDRTDGVLASSNETRSNCELATILDESSASLEISSSPVGEVKISLIRTSAAGRPDFRMPSLDAVLKLMEDKCLRPYKVLDPNFSVTKIMEDMCVCTWELGTVSSNESQETVIETPTMDLMKKSGAADAFGAGGMPSNLSNGPVNIPCNAKRALPQIPRLPPPCNGLDDHIQPDKRISSNDGVSEYEKDHEDLVHMNSQSVVVVQKLQLTPNDRRALHDANDIAKGQERISISLANEVNSECPPSFHYIPQNVVFQNAYVNFALARIGDNNCCSTCFGDCLSSSTLCACAHETGGDFVYTTEGLVKEEFLDECISMNRDPQKHCLYYCKECPLERSKNEDILEPCKGHLVRRFIKECWWKCGCNKQCGNRVVQRGINCKLQVFMTPGGKGWGLRTLEELPKGAFVCEYVGEVLTNSELYDRVSRSPSSEAHSYPVLLDADWCSEGVLKDEEALCLDATYYGNVARFINHRCFDSNLVEIPVEVETPDHHYYHLAFFTTRKVEALEELTWVSRLGIY